MAEPKTVFTYTLDGANRLFTIPFEYLARKYVVVTAIGASRVPLVVNVDYRFISPTQIQTTLALGGADGYATIEVRRYTSATERLVTFNDGSILRANDMNLSQIQTLHVAEEARDLTSDTIGVNNDGNLDARGKKIINLLAGTDPLDAVSYGQLQAFDESALNSSISAAASAASALAYKNAAGVSEANALTSANNADVSEANALLYSQNAATSAGNALTSANNADVSEANALTSANNADVSEGNALTSANNAATSASEAAGYAAGLNLPSATGNALKFLRQNAGATGLEYVESYTKAEQDVTNTAIKGVKRPVSWLTMLNTWTMNDANCVIIEYPTHVLISGRATRPTAITAVGDFAVFRLPFTAALIPYAPAVLSSTTVTGGYVATFNRPAVSSTDVLFAKSINDNSTVVMFNVTIWK